MIPFQDAASLGAPKLLSRQDLIAVILRLEFEGWRAALAADPNLTNAVAEPYMNGRLFQGMVSVRNSLGLTNIYLVETPGVRPRPAPALPEREPDLIFLFAEFGSNEPHAVIECKRLDPLDPAHTLRGEYVRSGMDRFINGDYGQGHDLDFMVGYLLRGDGDAAVRDVNEYLTNVKRTNCHLRATQAHARLGFVAESDHVRINDNSTFRLLHSFLSFPTEHSQVVRFWI
jgi:hypothetical protein